MEINDFLILNGKSLLDNKHDHYKIIMTDLNHFFFARPEVKLYNDNFGEL